VPHERLLYSAGDFGFITGAETVLWVRGGYFVEHKIRRAKRRNRVRASATTLAAEVSDNELAALKALLKTRRLKGPHLEIGTAAGGTLKELMRCYADAERPRFVVVDPMQYFFDQLAAIQRNLASAGFDPDQVDFRVDMSWPAFRQASRAGERFSFIFVDASHQIHHVTEDLAWTRLLEPGGIICFHDYNRNFPGVMLAVDRFLARYRNYRAVEHVDSLLIVEKTAASSSKEISVWERLRARIINVLHKTRASARKRMRRAAGS
jgi:predicted O-methyltransferase YrrM